MEELMAQFKSIHESSESSKDKLSAMTTKIKFLQDNKIHAKTLDYVNKDQINCMEYFRLISGLAEICPSTALSFSMHLYTIWGLGYLFNEEQKQYYFNMVKDENYLFSSLNSAGLFFVQPKKIKKEEFPIFATKVDGGYVVNGIKRTVSLEPFVRFLPVYSLIEIKPNEYDVALLIIDKHSQGIDVNPDWETISMQATYSHSIQFTNVYVPDTAVMFEEGVAIDYTENLGYIYQLGIAAVYYGMAVSAIDYIVNICKNRKVPFTGSLLASFPGVQFTLSESIILQETSLSQIMRFASELDHHLQTGLHKSQSMMSLSLITKDYVTKSAEKIVNNSMKIEGISSLGTSNRLSKLYQDVKAGLFHPPQHDVTAEFLAKNRIGIIQIRNRWL
ncbi:acyl-CoA dehydrogenase family protein [Paenibacillus taichungensis]|uniref:acyl-CoA dehydrogenase family protein n=1 Tax=Paenibacillus taichungensis TaxID=484184 RepID=UPI0038D04872